MDPVYILIRTSGRPKFFARMMESVKAQTYKNIITIVHTDDPRDEYVTGDIILKGSAYPRDYGNGTYNLYQNRLLKAIPEGPGWYHFIDDDDEYASPDVIERLVANSKRDHFNIGRVVRWNGVIFPKPQSWINKDRKEFQTEIFFLHTDHKLKAKWWANTSGDHYYSRQLTKILPMNWIDDLIICKAQEGKGHGRRLDAGGKISKTRPTATRFPVLGLVAVRTGNPRTAIRQGEFKIMDADLAERLEREGKVKITYPGSPLKAPVRNIFEMAK
jgi:hypothetical protein